MLKPKKMTPEERRLVEFDRPTNAGGNRPRTSSAKTPPPTMTKPAGSRPASPRPKMSPEDMRLITDDRPTSAAGNFKKGGEMKESKAMMKKEISFFKKKGAPKSMIKHEEAEAKGKAKGYAKGGSFRSEANGVASKGKTKAKQVRMNSGGSMKGC